MPPHTQSAARILPTPPTVTPTATQPLAATEPVLDQDQQRLVELILDGKNVFYTGSAGCGKSTVLRYVVKRLQREGKRVDVVAPTGRAALDVNGMTTYLYAGWRVGDFAKPLEELERAARTESVVQRISSTKVLIIDEIKAQHGKYVLLPVQVLQNLSGRKECEFEYVYLKNIHRQSDPKFIDLLERFRIGK
ncbi:hypothetical protein J4E80_005730 [Alternaria sp. BMP 0032]|nr:hypothetical protein J4E80_005730 [Alternaria sp. BMP 0032]